jgi:hypothetical protein
VGSGKEVTEVSRGKQQRGRAGGGGGGGSKRSVELQPGKWISFLSLFVFFFLLFVVVFSSFWW